eukprot:scaffold44064_cov22-Prasinocladus_malaysianus.AAC.1
MARLAWDVHTFPSRSREGEAVLSNFDTSDVTDYWWHARTCLGLSSTCMPYMESIPPCLAGQSNPD